MYIHVNYTKKQYKMDIFDNKILCKKCGKEMEKVLIQKNGFNLRAVKCSKCNEVVYHPDDLREYEEFMKLKEKEFNVKMRMVGNSYAVSIPKEIVDFMKEQEKIMNNVVRMCFEEAGKISLKFNVSPENSRVVGFKEARVIKNGKPVFYARRIYDSANPQLNKAEVYRDDEE
ncbi:MAG: hypothetical protein QXX68_01885 [Candidatus Pacearchaeota archaeon]